jgi:hypothetical protein
LAQETLWLFGVGTVEVTPELSPALVQLIKVEQGEAEADG